MTKKKKIIMLLITMTSIFTCIGICGWKVFFGNQKNKVEFRNLSTIQQTEINKSIKVLIGIEPNIETITYTVYKNGVSNYNIKFNNHDISDVMGDNLPELDESCSSTNLTGYYYKHNNMYLIIGERNYSKWIDEDNNGYSNETLKELDNLIKLFSELFNNY